MTIYEALPSDGAECASDIARRAGMPLERVYEALVALEARRQARVVVYRVGDRRVCLWERV
jgi:sugar-specific transcriptional regulator TrmB